MIRGLVVLAASLAATHAQLYNCQSREVWTKEKTTWCCTTLGMGCAVTTEERVNPKQFEPRDCRTKEKWSPEKSKYCCDTLQLGCPTEVVHECNSGTATRFGCPVARCMGPQSYPAGCALVKRYEFDEHSKQCCPVLCNYETKDGTVCRPSSLTEEPVVEEEEEEEEEEVKGASVVPFRPGDCRTREKWSPEKSKYCCDTLDLGCPVKEEVTPQSTQFTPMDCRTREKWSPEKSKYCCDTLDLGCPEVVEVRTETVGTVRFLSVHGASETSATLLWVPPAGEASCENAEYRVMYRRIGKTKGKFRRLPATSDTFVALTNLTPGRLYEARVIPAQGEPALIKFRTRKGSS